MPADLHFLRPLWFLALLPLAVLLFLLARRRSQDRVWRSLVDPHLLPHLLDLGGGGSRRLPLALLALGWSLAVLALAGPVWQRLPVPVFTLDTNRVVLLDLSPSMNAADIPPSRLARARFEVLDLLAASREGQVALVAYGPEPFVVSPLTADAKTIADQVPRLASDLIPVPGARRTDRALEAAGDLLAVAGGGPGQVILISDGVGGSDPADQGRALAAARRLAEAGHGVSVLAVGTAAGAPVPGAAGDFAAGSNGSIRLSRLDRGGLEALARAGGGRLVDLDLGEEDTRALLSEAPRGGPEVLAQDALTADQWLEEGPWILLVLLPLAALAFRRGWLLPVLAYVVLLPPAPAWALDWQALWQRPDQRGAQALAAGDPVAASFAFQDPAWRAVARYRAGDYGGALEALADLAGAEVDYNRGNALARLDRLDEAIASYERALEQDPGLADARANLELLRRLKEQQQQEEPPTDPQSGSETEGSWDEPDQGSEAEPDEATEGQGEEPSAQGGAQEEAQEPEAGGQGQSGAPEANDQAAGQDGAPQGTEQRDRGSEAGPTPGADPSAADLSPGSGDGEPRPEPTGPGAEAQESEGTRPSGGPAPDPAGSGLAAGGDELTPEERERRQALEAQLRRVPDDPAGLLRQRFILQHLRREGRLP